jgi:hypothetical protein
MAKLFFAVFHDLGTDCTKVTLMAQQWISKMACEKSTGSLLPASL